MNLLERLANVLEKMAVATEPFRRIIEVRGKNLLANGVIWDFNLPEDNAEKLKECLRKYLT